MRWPVAGLVAALVAEAALFGGRLATGAPTPAELLQDRLLELLPGPLFGFLIDSFGFWGKPVLLLGLVGATVAFGALVVAGYGRWGPSRNRAPISGALLGLGLWLLGGLALAALGGSFWGGPPAAILALAGALVFGLVLMPLARPVAPAADPSRRRALALLGGGAALALGGGAALALGGGAALALGGGAALALGGELWRIVEAMGERGTPPRPAQVATARLAPTPHPTPPRPPRCSPPSPQRRPWQRRLPSPRRTERRRTRPPRRPCRLGERRSRPAQRRRSRPPPPRRRRRRRSRPPPGSRRR